MTNDHLSLLRHLQGHADGVRVLELAPALRDPDNLMLCEADGLIEFRRRSHCHTGDGVLHIENGWEWCVITQEGCKPMASIFDEQIGVDKRVQLHVRLTAAGRVAVARSKASGPASLISASVATAKYNVTARTLQRHIEKGTLTDHRKAGHADNAPFELDEAEVAKRWKKR